MFDPPNKVELGRHKTCISETPFVRFREAHGETHGRDEDFVLLRKKHLFSQKSGPISFKATLSKPPRIHPFKGRQKTSRGGGGIPTPAISLLGFMSNKKKYN